MSEFIIHNVTYKNHCSIKFRAIGPHKLVVAKGLVDEVGVEEHDEGVQEAASR
jgi:hypothetical protein